MITFLNLDGLLLLRGDKMEKGHVGDVEWEVMDLSPERKFFRVIDAGKKVMIDGEVEGPRVTFDVMGVDESVVDAEREIFEKDLLRLGKLDIPVEEILHEIADDLAFMA